MWEMKLLNATMKASAKRPARRLSQTFSRTIKQQGNGLKRTVVSGFNGPNLDEIHFKRLSVLEQANARVVISGFGGQKGLFKRISGIPNRGFVRFFPISKSNRIQRHVVYDVPTQRKVVNGFSLSSDPIIVSKGTPNVPFQKPQIATERVVVQGFGGNTSKPIYKQMPTEEKTRTIVKGFMA